MGVPTSDDGLDMGWLASAMYCVAPLQAGRAEVGPVQHSSILVEHAQRDALAAPRPRQYGAKSLRAGCTYRQMLNRVLPGEDVSADKGFREIEVRHCHSSKPWPKPSVSPPPRCDGLL